MSGVGATNGGTPESIKNIAKQIGTGPTETEKKIFESAVHATEKAAEKVKDTVSEFISKPEGKMVAAGLALHFAPPPFNFVGDALILGGTAFAAKEYLSKHQNVAQAVATGAVAAAGIAAAGVVAGPVAAGVATAAVAAGAAAGVIAGAKAAEKAAHAAHDTTEAAKKALASPEAKVVAGALLTPLAPIIGGAILGIGLAEKATEIAHDAKEAGKAAVQGAAKEAGKAIGHAAHEAAKQAVQKATEKN